MEKIVVDSNIAIPKIKHGRPRGTGAGIIYDKGKEIWETLKVGDSTYITRINPKALHLRLNRVSIQNEIKKKFTFRREEYGYRCFRIE